MAARAATNDSGHVTETITYIPGHGDPAITMWGGVTFHANTPKELTGHPDGTKREQLNMELIERARDNKHFTVGGVPRAKKKASAPENADQYRAYMADWLKEEHHGERVINSVTKLIERFAKEREMRVPCEVGASDYDLIGTLFNARLGELAKQEELTAEQLSALWVQHGFNELPW